MLSQFVTPTYRGIWGAIYFTGSGTLTWGRASIGLNAATIEIIPGQCGNIYVGSASPGTLGWDLAITGLLMPQATINAGTQDLFLNAEATFTGSISAYGCLMGI